MRHFLQETDFSREEAASIFELAGIMKRERATPAAQLQRQSWGLLFDKSSTRTRVSFEVGIHELGGYPVVLNTQTTQLGRGETVGDTARVLSRYLHGIIIRTFEHAIVREFAEAASVPIVNALTDAFHPCQIYADLFTMAERWSPDGRADPEALRGRKIAFLGDTACNVAHSWILGAAQFGMEVALAGPESFEPGEVVRPELEAAGLPANFHFTRDAAEAADGADAVYTDVWVSMGTEEESVRRKEWMQPYAVTAEIMRRAGPRALFMHCLPAHAGEEVSQEVLDSDRCIIFDQAENRLHMQKAILAQLVEINGTAPAL